MIPILSAICDWKLKSAVDKSASSAHKQPLYNYLQIMQIMWWKGALFGWCGFIIKVATNYELCLLIPLEIVYGKFLKNTSCIKNCAPLL